MKRFFSPTFICLILMRSLTALAATNQPAGSIPASPPVPELGFSIFRLLGGLVFVLALFLLGAWLFKNWRRLAAPRGVLPKLNILEIRALGSRQFLYVVGYQEQRLLLASSPAGIVYLRDLPAAEQADPDSEPPAPRASFADALQQILHPRA